MMLLLTHRSNQLCTCIAYDMYMRICVAHITDLIGHVSSFQLASCPQQHNLRLSWLSSPQSVWHALIYLYTCLGTLRCARLGTWSGVRIASMQARTGRTRLDFHHPSVFGGKDVPADHKLAYARTPARTVQTMQHTRAYMGVPRDAGTICVARLTYLRK